MCRHICINHATAMAEISGSTDPMTSIMNTGADATSTNGGTTVSVEWTSDGRDGFFTQCLIVEKIFMLKQYFCSVFLHA